MDDSTPPARTLPPLRATLEHLLVLYRQPRDDPAEPWELKLAPDLGREQTANDLQAYLEAGIPPQGLTWLLRPPERHERPIFCDRHGRRSIRLSLCSSRLAITFRRRRADVTGPAGSPVKELRVIYPKPKQEPVFWRPRASLGGRAATLDIGWLWLYILVYLPTLVLVRATFRVA